jgi:hypothetical protein
VKHSGDPENPVQSITRVENIIVDPRLTISGGDVFFELLGIDKPSNFAVRALTRTTRAPGLR